MNKVNIKIFDESIAALENTQYSQANGYTLNEHNVLLHNGEPVDWNVAASDLMTQNIGIDTVIKCPECGEWCNDYRLVHCFPTNKYICYDCLSSSTDYFYCEDCNDWYANHDYNSYVTYRGYTICENCRDNHYVECGRCHEIYPQDDTYYCDECDEYYCEDCWNDHYHEENLLYDYHTFNDWRLHKTDDEPEPEFYIGHELEIDYGDDMQEAVNTINDIGGICMHDGSLTYQGIEFISHPLSLNYRYSQEEEYRKAFEHLKNLGYRSHETNTCGLHFHVTRPNDSKVIDRIILFMETYKEEIIKLSRRQSSELNRWSRFLSDKRTSLNEKVIKSLDYIVENKDTSDRYMALNLTNAKTIEFRFFKGTLNYDTFMADLEFINNLVEFASNLDMPIEELTWTLVTSKGKFLPHYIEENSMKSDRPLIDYSKELMVEFNKAKEELRIESDNLLREILKVISNKARTKNNTSAKIRNTYNVLFNYTECLSTMYELTKKLETLSALDYNKLEDIKNYVRYLKERLGK